MSRYILISIGGLVVLVILILILKRRKNRIKPEYFKQKWQDLQKLCANRDSWPMALLDADGLLDEALKKRRFKGKSMGERMVSAQRDFSDNDTLWFAHNMAKKVAAESIKRLRESDVKKSLVGIRQGLRDLGVLNDK